MKILKDLLYDTRISEIHGTTHTAVEGIGIDSREVKPMGLFIAIKGTQVDGHDYIKQAITNGATTIICEYISDIVMEESLATYLSFFSVVFCSGSRRKASKSAMDWWSSPSSRPAGMMDAP